MGSCEQIYEDKKVLYGPIWVPVDKHRRTKKCCMDQYGGNFKQSAAQFPPVAPLLYPSQQILSSSPSHVSVECTKDPLLMGPGLGEMALLGGWGRRKEV